MDKLKITDLYSNIPTYLNPYFQRAVYPWELLPRIKEITEELIEAFSEKYELIGEGILVGENVKIHESAVINGPSVIGSGTEIRPSAYIRGSVIIGEGCVIGNSTELKNCILMDKVQAPHYNYVGDSILGYKSHLGAGVICSNLKSDKGNVVVHGEENYETGLRKVGAFVGDEADVGCSSVLNPGTVVGRGTQVYPLTLLRGAYPERCIVKSSTEWVKKSL